MQRDALRKDLSAAREREKKAATAAPALAAELAKVRAEAAATRKTLAKTTAARDAALATSTPKRPMRPRSKSGPRWRRRP